MKYAWPSAAKANDTQRTPIEIKIYYNPTPTSTQLKDNKLFVVTNFWSSGFMINYYNRANPMFLRYNVNIYPIVNTSS